MQIILIKIGNKMIKQIFTVVLLLTSLLIAQDEYKPWVKAERERFAKTRELSKIMYPGDSKIDVTYYGLDLKITTNPNNLIGNVTIGVKTDTTSLNSCFLDLRNFLVVDSVLLNGSLTTYSHANNLLNITLDHTYTQDETFTLKVYYHGLPGSSGFGGFYFGSHNGTVTISSLSEAYSGPYWWPQKDTPADKADSSDMRITVASNLIAVSNGTLESVIDNGNGTKTYYWKNHYTIANYLISLAITNYYQYNTYYHYSPTDSMIITHFIYPENFNSVKQYLDETDNMIEVFANRFGEYPFLQEKYGHAEFDWGGAMEHQTCTSMGFWGSGVVSHELSHQWYGDMITCKDWHHIWLNEGFATYAEAVYIEAKSGKAAYDSDIASEMSYAKSAVGTIWVQDITQEWNIFDGARSYAKGGVVLHMLRGVVGDSTFFDIMRTYSDTPGLKYGVATTEDFQAVAESVSGQDLNYFFQEWIYGENYPKYTVGWNKSLVSGDVYHITLNIYQTVNTNPAYFTMPVQIKINFASGDTTVTLFNNAQTQNFQFDVIGNPTTITFDPGNWILKTLQGVTEVEDFSVPAQYSLEQNYPNPFNPSTSIEYSLPKSGFVSLKVFNVLGKEVATLVNGQNDAGKHKVDFNAIDLNSGVYFYRIESANFVETKKMILLK
jgi:aminopeptidase N